MKLFFLERLDDWLKEPNRKPLVLSGARQVGKTWLLKEFGRTRFDSVAYVNFDKNASAAMRKFSVSGRRQLEIR